MPLTGQLHMLLTDRNTWSLLNLRFLRYTPDNFMGRRKKEIKIPIWNAPKTFYCPAHCISKQKINSNWIVFWAVYIYTYNKHCKPVCIHNVVNIEATINRTQSTLLLFSVHWICLCCFTTLFTALPGGAILRVFIFN